MTTSYARRVEVLRLARQYDLMILEDDPYYFLYYGASPRPPSYLTLERQVGGQLGRVLRFDSFSKILSAGFRLGWVSGPETILTAIERHVSPQRTARAQAHNSDRCLERGLRCSAQFTLPSYHSQAPQGLGS